MSALLALRPFQRRARQDQPDPPRRRLAPPVLPGSFLGAQELPCWQMPQTLSAQAGQQQSLSPNTSTKWLKAQQDHAPGELRAGHGDDSCCATEQRQHSPVPRRALGVCPGPAQAALTEPGRELLCAQAPGASSIQPIEHKLQLLPAARQTFLLQFLKPEQIGVNPHLSHHLQSPQQCWTPGDAPMLTCMSERVTIPACSVSLSLRRCCTLCIISDAHGGSSAGLGAGPGASLEPSCSCLRRLEPKRRPLAAPRRSDMALVSGDTAGTEPCWACPHWAPLLQPGGRQQRETELQFILLLSSTNC